MRLESHLKFAGFRFVNLNIKSVCYVEIGKIFRYPSKYWPQDFTLSECKCCNVWMSWFIERRVDFAL